MPKVTKKKTTKKKPATKTCASTACDYKMTRAARHCPSCGFAQLKIGPKLQNQIDWPSFDKLCELQCTLREISSFFDCSIDTVERAVKREKGMLFSEYRDLRAGNGKISLRRRQMELAESGNATMLVWLGKQWLGQADKVEQKNEHAVAVRPIILPDNGRS